MNHVEMKVFPSKENDGNLFSKMVKVKSDLKICFQMVEVWKLYLVKIFLKILRLKKT